MSLASSSAPNETGLLVPFEIQNLPTTYKEYYLTKRNNFFSSIQGFPEVWKLYTMPDEIWLQEFSDLKPPGRTAQFFPLMLYMNAHARLRVSIELALSGAWLRLVRFSRTQSDLWLMRTQ
jgi:hypothetical protein